MRYPASEKLAIIQLIEQSSLPVRRTLAQLGIPKSTFYDWYRRYEDRRTGCPGRWYHPGLSGSGTSCLKTGGKPSSAWPWRNLLSRPGSWQ